MDTTAQYAELNNSIQLTSDLIATNEKQLVSDGTNINIVKVEPG